MYSYTLQNEMANGGVSSPQCSTVTAPISMISDAASLIYGRFRTGTYAFDESKKIITYTTLNIHVHVHICKQGQKEQREGTGPLNPLSSLDLMFRKNDRELELSIRISLQPHRERQSNGVGSDMERMKKREMDVCVDQVVLLFMGLARERTISPINWRELLNFNVGGRGLRLHVLFPFNFFGFFMQQ